MDWSEIGTQIILGIIGVLLTSLGTLITFLINKYVKNDQLKRLMGTLNEVVKNAVSETYQTYVEALKKDGMFSKEAQKIALEKALMIIKDNLPKDVMDWVKENYSDIDTFLKSQIEAVIGLLKNSGKANKSK